MKNSSERILTTHVGSLARPMEILDQCGPGNRPSARPRGAGGPYSGLQVVVQRQARTGIDVPSDGEFSKTSFSTYVNDRLTGFESKPLEPGESPLQNWGRDRTLFSDFYREYDAPIEGAQAGRMVCTGPIKYQGQASVQRDIDNFKAALATAEIEEAFIPACAPGTIELQRTNDYYATQEEYLGAIADAMREEYRAIVEAGFILQIDDPRVVTQYGMDPAPTIEEYRDFAALRVEAINQALPGCRRNGCGTSVLSWHGPHVTDVPLRDIVDIILGVNAGAYCVEAANPRHAHEWEVWESARLPDGKVLAPVVAHTTNIVAGVGGAADRQLCALVGRRDRRNRLRVFPGSVQSPGSPVDNVGQAGGPGRRRGPGFRAVWG